MIGNEWVDAQRHKLIVSMLKDKCQFDLFSQHEVFHIQLKHTHTFLQALKPLVEQLPPSDIEPMLLAWTPVFQRLVMDNTR